jgi:hypothetical protein
LRPGPKPLDHVRRRQFRAGRDSGGCLQAERAGEDRETTQQDAFKLVQQLVTPVERRPQRLVPRRGRPPSAGQQTEAIVETGGESLDAERGGTRRRQLDRQRESVELPADRCNYRHKAAVRRKTRLCRPRPLDEQPNGAVAQGIVVSRDIGRRHGEPLHRINPFARRSERLAAVGDDMHRRGGPQYSLGYRRDSGDQMLAGIEHQQHPPAGEGVRHALC